MYVTAQNGCLPLPLPTRNSPPSSTIQRLTSYLDSNRSNFCSIDLFSLTGLLWEWQKLIRCDARLILGGTK
ncbi:hypothetical protein SADUNF_Sadunf05G0123700 [Salix dunnii]|uniref:Uncharacterized protein n=1 Tax=Salix dunnii TaxID=1413687 RepID=A0A835MZB7_9ROSI|nr:hypothetical protein SADUNF_Sadunf05G0123700 [Salix dunnii]